MAKVTKVRLEFIIGTTIESACQTAAVWADDFPNISVSFDFNDKVIKASGRDPDTWELVKYTPEEMQAEYFKTK